jgi:SAM-dependent methyltransferase
MLSNILQFCGWTLLAVFGWVLLIRVIRKLVHFPMPEFMAGLIDNPWRHVVMPPAQTAARHALQPGMTVLEIGPGNGTYSVAAARGLLPGGRLVCIDIEPKMLARLQRKVRAAGLTNVEMRLADVCHLPYEDAPSTPSSQIVIGELPTHTRPCWNSAGCSRRAARWPSASCCPTRIIRCRPRWSGGRRRPALPAAPCSATCSITPWCLGNNAYVQFPPALAHP